jgi:hypothetical protein
MTGDSTHTDALAAEYVLGTLDADERKQAQALLGTDEGFVAKVKQWERRLGELHLMVEPVEPDGKIWERIKAKMPEAVPSPDIKLPEPQVEPVVEPVPEAPGAESKTDVPVETPPEASPAIVPEALASPPADAAPVAPETTSWAPRLVARAPSPAPAPTPPAVPALTPSATRTPSVRGDEAAARGAAAGRGGGPWRALATLMTLVVVAMAGLVAAWRFVPERVPAPLQPAELMRLVGVHVGSGQPVRRPAPPESQFDE